MDDDVLVSIIWKLFGMLAIWMLIAATVSVVEERERCARIREEKAR